MEYVVFDLETTGFSAKADSIIEIGAWKVVDGFAIEKFSSYVRPDCGIIPSKITKMTGITEEDVMPAPFLADILPVFLDFIGDRTVVCHNAVFDCGFIKEKADKLGYTFDRVTDGSARQAVCTLKAVKKLYPSMSHKLSSCVDAFGLANGMDINYHRAVNDAYMTMYLYEYLRGQFGDIPILRGVCL